MSSHGYTYGDMVKVIINAHNTNGDGGYSSINTVGDTI